MKLASPADRMDAIPSFWTIAWKQFVVIWSFQWTTNRDDAPIIGVVLLEGETIQTVRYHNNKLKDCTF